MDIQAHRGEVGDALSVGGNCNCHGFPTLSPRKVPACHPGLTAFILKGDHVTEGRILALLLSLGYTMLTLFAIHSGLPAPGDLVTAIALFWMLVSASLWLLSDEVIREYRLPVWMRLFVIANRLTQVIFLSMAGWLVTWIFLMLAWTNEQYREHVAYARLEGARPGDRGTQGDHRQSLP